jgi:hypothetical protein
MQAEDVSEQLTTIETILKLAAGKEIVEIEQSQKIKDYTCCEQLRLVLLEKRN